MVESDCRQRSLKELLAGGVSLIAEGASEAIASGIDESIDSTELATGIRAASRSNNSFSRVTRRSWSFFSTKALTSTMVRAGKGLMAW